MFFDKLETKVHKLSRSLQCDGVEILQFWLSSFHLPPRYTTHKAFEHLVIQQLRVYYLTDEFKHNECVHFYRASRYVSIRSVVRRVGGLACRHQLSQLTYGLLSVMRKYGWGEWGSQCPSGTLANPSARCCAGRPSDIVKNTCRAQLANLLQYVSCNLQRWEFLQSDWFFLSHSITQPSV